MGGARRRRGGEGENEETGSRSEDGEGQEKREGKEKQGLGRRKWGEELGEWEKEERAGG